jgi:hypothetical protein
MSLQTDYLPPKRSGKPPDPSIYILPGAPSHQCPKQSNNGKNAPLLNKPNPLHMPPNPSHTPPSPKVPPNTHPQPLTADASAAKNPQQLYIFSTNNDQTTPAATVQIHPDPPPVQCYPVAPSPFPTPPRNTPTQRHSSTIASHHKSPPRFPI